MHQLHEDVPALGVHGLGDRFPGGHVFGGFDTWSADVAFARRVGKYAFRYDQTGGGALGVVSGHKVGRHTGVVGARACHRRHDQAVGEGVATKGKGREKSIHGGVPNQ